MIETPQPIAETMPVRDTHRFDVAALESYMRGHVPGFGGPLTVRQFVGGQSNPTYYLADQEREYVLRRKPPGKLLPSAHAVDREYRVISALAGTGVPVPRTYALCEDPSVIGTAFYIMQYVRGRILVDPRLPGVPNAERAHIYDAMNEVLARLHQVDWKAVGLSRQLRRSTDPPLDHAVPRVRDGDDSVDGAADRVAARAHPRGRHDQHRAWRLPTREHDHP
jgi:aminoglycoside phosphotransferase (APT) family kinase protein